MTRRYDVVKHLLVIYSGFQLEPDFITQELICAVYDCTPRLGSVVEFQTNDH